MSDFGIIVRAVGASTDLAPNLGPRARGLRATQVLPGGCGMATWRIFDSIRYPPPYLGIGYEVRLTDGAGVWWSGRMEDFRSDSGADGPFWDIAAYGWGVAGADDGIYTIKDLSNTATSTVVANGITDLMQNIDIQTITASGYTISAATAVSAKMLTGGALFKLMGQFGNSSNSPMIWVAQARNNGDVEFFFKLRPTTTDILGRRRDANPAPFGLVGRQLANRVIAEYNSGASTVTVEDTALQTAWGFTRAKAIFVPEITQPADATQIATSVLTDSKVARMGAVSAHYTFDALFTDSNRRRVPPWRVQAGMLFQFADVSPAAKASGGLAYSNSMLIAGVEIDEDARTVVLAPESYDMTSELAVARAMRLLEGRHTTARSAS